MLRLFPCATAVGTVVTATVFCGIARAHEAWLLTPAEIETLADAPVPYIFTSYSILSVAAVIGCVATLIALYIEKRIRPYEVRIEPSFTVAALIIGPVVLRLGLAAMLVLAATGGLPRHGVAMWVEPTLFVPDMQLSLAPGWGWLIIAQMLVAALLVAGLFTRLAGLGVIILTGVGLVVFGSGFLAYAPHFLAPGLILVIVGGGPLSVDHQVGLDHMLARFNPPVQPSWRLAQILIGAGFIYLAVVYKLTQPTLLIAILQHGEMPTFGLSYPLIALIMTGIEIICGTLLVVGRLIRPVSLAIIGAITFLALTLGETPLFHANLYGSMAIILLAGHRLRLSRGGSEDLRGSLA